MAEEDFHHACMNENLYLPQVSVRTHASEMQRSGIEPLRNRYITVNRKL